MPGLLTCLEQLGKLNHLQTGVGQFHLSMQKWVLVPSLNCECGIPQQSTDHILILCPIHWAPNRAQALTVLDNKT